MTTDIDKEMLMRFGHGEMIVLTYVGVPDAFYVMGHVTITDFNKALNYQDPEYREDYKLGKIKRRYARWSTQGDQIFFVDHNKPGRGRFKVTCREVIDVR